MSAYTRAVQEAAASVGGDDVGFSFKKAAKAVGRNVGKGAKAVGKAAIATPVGTLKLTAKAGKLGFKGTKAAVNYARKNPGLIAAASIPGLGIPVAAVAIQRNRKRKKAAAAKKRKAAATLLSASESSSTSMAAPMPRGKRKRPRLTSTDTAVNMAAPMLATSPGPMPANAPVVDTVPDDMAADDDQAEYEAEDESSVEVDTSEEEESSDEVDAEEESDSETENTDSEVSGMSDDGEYIGWDEIGLDDIGGAPRTGGNPAAGRVKQKSYTRARRQVVGFNSVSAIAAAASGSAVASPQTLFRGRKLIIPSTLAPSFNIDNILIGVQSQFAAAGAIPGEAFLPTTTGEDNLTMDTCNPGFTITLNVTNTSGGPLTFRAAMFGDSMS